MTAALLLCSALALSGATGTQAEAPSTVAAPKEKEKKPQRDPSKDVFSDAEPPVAPEKSTPWLKSPFIFIAQFLGGVGARAAVVPLWCVPVVGPPVAVVLTPVLESVAITYVGDRMGDGRAPLIPSLLVSGAFSGTAALLTAGAALGAGAVLLGWGSLLTPGSPTADMVQGMPIQWLLAGTLSALLALGAALVAAAALTAVSPVASVAVYQFLKRRKPKGDNGTGWFSLFSRPEQELPTPPVSDGGKAP